MVRSYALPLAATGPTRLSAVYDSYGQAVLADQPMAFWRLNEGPGAVTAVDAVGSYSGTYVGATPALTLGVPPLTDLGSAMQLVTVDTSTFAGVRIPNFPIPRFITIEAIVKPTSGAPVLPFPRIWSSGSVINFPLDVSVDYSGGLGVFLNTIGGSPAWKITATITKRSHLAVTWDETALRVYLDGALIFTDTTDAGRQLNIWGSAAGFRYIGYAESGTCFTGVIDELAIYPRALTPQQIAAHAAASLANPYAARVLADQPTAYWHLDEASGLILADSAGARPITLASAAGVTYGVPGLADATRGLAFDGTTAYVGTCPPLITGTTFSIELWLTPNGDNAAAQDYQTIFIGPSPGFIGLYKMGSTYGPYFNRLNFFGPDVRYNNTPLVNGRRYHVVVVVQAGALTFYLNGVADGAVVGPNPPVPSISLQKLFCLSAVDGPDSLKASLVDELAFYYYALTAAQVQAHYQLGVTLPTADIDDDLPFRQLLISPDPANAGPIVIGDKDVAAGAGGEGIVLAAPPLSPPSGGTAYRDRILLDTPLGYWRLGETAGLVAADASGNNHPGAYNGGVLLGAPSLVAGSDAALALPGTPLNGVNLPGIPQPSRMSIELWVKRAGTQNGFARLYASQGAFEVTFAAGPSGQLVLYVGFIEGASDFINTGVIVPDGIPTHVVALWDGTAIRVYLNGVQAYQNATWTGRTLPFIGTSQAKALGTIEGFTVSGAELVGTLDECALYSVALSAATIAAHYQAGIVSYAQRILADAPTGYWRLGEASGLTAADSSGHGYAGTITGGVTLAQPGAIASDTAALFNGTTGYISVPHAAPLAPTADFSVEAWVRFSGSTPLDIINHYGAGNFKGFFFAASESLADGRLELWTGNGWFRGTRVINDGQWHHVAATITGTTARIYVDGVLDSTGVATLDLGPVTFALEIGRRHDTLTYASGLIDEVALYSYALTPAQVLAHYQARALPFSAGSYPYRVLQDGATNYWRLNEASGLVAVDSIGGKNGTISGGVTLAQPGALASGDKAMTFDGATGKILTTAPVTLAPPWTYEAWFYYRTDASYPPVFDTTFTPPNAQDLITIYVGPNAALTWRHYLVGTTNSELAAVSSFALTQGWHHIVVITTSLVPLIYIDGVAQTLAVLPTAPVGTISQPIEFGAIPWQSIFLRGSLDDIALYPFALTPAQIAAHYATALSAPAALADRVTLGPFDTGPIKLSHIYAAGSGALRILGVPY